METQEQPRITRDDQQTQTYTAIKQDDDPKECTKTALKVSIGIGGITGSMIGVLAGNEHKKSDSLFIKISNLLLWASFVLSVTLMVLTLLSIKHKQLVIIVKIAMYATIILLILTVVDVFIVYVKSGNI
uniref:Uncharacterized protein LOC105060718 n=1 Tax=Elaeis guineensis var. tenera TaxID=51953 RepID=A0A8N4EXI8_ELAGV|nr:uncharacterized protein LOC105060718 [Elaeis guineensis]